MNNSSYSVFSLIDFLLSRSFVGCNAPQLFRDRSQVTPCDNQFLTTQHQAKRVATNDNSNLNTGSSLRRLCNNKLFEIPCLMMCLMNIIKKSRQKIGYYVWAKRTKFLLAVIYGSPGRHSNISKTFKKDRKILKSNFMIILGLAEF